MNVVSLVKKIWRGFVRSKIQWRLMVTWTVYINRLPDFEIRKEFCTNMEKKVIEEL